MQRSDDTEEKARNRLRTYHANVDAVIGYYKQQLVEVGGWRGELAFGGVVDGVLPGGFVGVRPQLPRPSLLAWPSLTLLMAPTVAAYVCKALRV